MDKVLKELEKYRAEGYEYFFLVKDLVDVTIWKYDVRLKEIWQLETIEDALKQTLRWIYKVKRVPHRLRVKL